jgi:hypothetical protein
VQTLVVFKWKRGEVSHHGQGITRDISTRGMFIYSEDGPPVKTNLDLEVAFARFGEKGSRLQMTSKSTVLRVEPPMEPGALHGFAVVHKSYKLHAGSTLVEGRNWNKD